MAKTTSKNCVPEVSRTVREAQPAHYLFKIKSFSMLVEEKINELESDDFEVGDYKWRLCLYPSGNEKANGSDHLSLYLVIKDTEKFPHSWEVNVVFKLFVYNHMEDNYLTILDAGAKTRRFNALNTRWGFSQFISLDAFNDLSNGYLFEDSCVFGAEIYVIKSSGRGECVSWIKEPENKCFTWKVENFSSITVDHLFSEKFTVGEQEWKLKLFPKGNVIPKGEWLSMYLCLANPLASSLKQSFYVRYTMRIKDQVSIKHYEKEVKHWFSPATEDWGFNKFKELSDLKVPSNGFLIKDTLIIEVEFMVISVVKKLP